MLYVFGIYIYINANTNFRNIKLKEENVQRIKDYHV